MENGQKPINPIVNSEGFVMHQSHLESITHQQFLTGLTKREYFAGLAMQGMLANPETFGDLEIMMIQAVRKADELLKQLEK